MNHIERWAAGLDLILAGARMIVGVPSYDEVNKGLDAMHEQQRVFAEEMQRSHRAIAVCLLHAVQMVPLTTVDDSMKDDIAASVKRLKELARK